MKIKRIHLLDGEALGILQGFEHVFAPQSDDSIEPYCFVGENGTGKSRLLQCLAEIFGWLDTRTRLFRANPDAEIGFRFELEYEVHSDLGPRQILIRNIEDRKRPQVLEVDEQGEETVISGEDNIRTVLPRFVVGYTSGENETLSVTFLDVKQDYGREITSRALKQVEDQIDAPDLRLVMMDYHANFAVIAANFLLQPTERLAFFKDYIRISDIESFRLIIQLSHRAAKPKGGVKLTQQLHRYVEKLQAASTCHLYEPKEKRWTLDFLVNEATRSAFKHFFGSAYELCMAFQRLGMLNDLMILKKHLDRINWLRRNQKIVVKPPTPAEEDKVFRFETVRLRLRDSAESLDYISISDGEHQFTHIFGTLLMFDQPNVLFLLDEPESHFNPQWRIKFVPLVDQIARGKYQCLLLTSHAPFVISDCKAQNVYIFRRNKSGQGVEVSTPEVETYGASFDHLLEDVFDVKPPPVARKSLSELRHLQQTGTKEEIEERLDEFGDSPVKFYLYQKLEKEKEKEKA